MRRAVLYSFAPIMLSAALCLVPFPAHAGEIYGRVMMGNAPAGDGATVTVRCGDAEYGPKPVGKGGAYQLIAGQSGKCTLTVTHKGQTASVDVVSYEDPVECNVVLEMKDGKLAARRR